MKVQPAPLSGSTLCTLWRVVLSDGTTLGFTDHDRDLQYNGQTYLASSGYTAASMNSAAGLSPDDLEIDGVLSSPAITEQDVIAGRWAGAAVTVMRANWSDLSAVDVLRTGQIGEIKVSGQGYTAELRGLSARLQRQIVNTVQHQCDARLGDARCSVSVAPVAAPITSVSNSRSFAAASLTHAAGHFRFGTVTWVTGENVGITRDIADHATGGVISLAVSCPYPIAAGDQINVTAGCDKLVSTCRDKFNNVLNFRGFPSVPGTDRAIQRAS